MLPRHQSDGSAIDFPVSPKYQARSWRSNHSRDSADKGVKTNCEQNYVDNPQELRTVNFIEELITDKETDQGEGPADYQCAPKVWESRPHL